MSIVLIPDYVKISEACLSSWASCSGSLRIHCPEDKVLLPASPELPRGEAVTPGDPPPPLRLCMADSEGLCARLVLGMDIAAGGVSPSVTTGVNPPLDNMTPVSGGVTHAQLQGRFVSRIVNSVILSSLRFKIWIQPKGE